MKKRYTAMRVPVCRCGARPVVRRRKQWDRIKLQWFLGMCFGFGHLGYEWIAYCPKCARLDIYHARTKRAALAEFERRHTA